jgi:hypothetical protein
MFSRFPSDRKNEVILLKDRCCLIFCCFWMFWSYIFSLIFKQVSVLDVWRTRHQRFYNWKGVFSENFEF